MKFKNIIYYLVGTLMISSCSSDYLDVQPTDSVDQSVTFESTENAKAAINGLAKLMTRQYNKQGFNGEGTIKMYYGNYPGNDFQRNLPGWSSIINAQYNQNVNSVYTIYPWFYYYKLILNANLILENIEKAAGPEAERQFIKAQAYCYRAYSYTMLSQLYCYRWKDSNNGSGKGLPLRLDTSKGDLPLSTLLETYQQIYSDLDAAINLFTESKLSRSNFFEPDINVAYAIYARAALTREDYATAKDYAHKARAGYPLMENKEYMAGFFDHNKEWIWGCHGATDENLYFWSYQALIGYNSSASLVRNYSVCISKMLFDQIPDTDIRKSLFLDPEQLSFDTNTNIAGDELAAKAFSLYPNLNAKTFPYAYMQFKIGVRSSPGVGDLVNFRSAEMYLIEAEAEYQLNQEAAACKLLVELNKDSGRNPSYTCNLTGDDLFQEIRLYRRIELFGEGFDWFDMKRWKLPIDRKGIKDGGSFISDFAIKIEPDDEDRNFWTWAIPAKETDFNDEID